MKESTMAAKNSTVLERYHINEYAKYQIACHPKYMLDSGHVQLPDLGYPSC